MADVKKTTVDAMTERLVKTNPKLTPEQAKKIAVESAERVNRKRQEGK